MTMTAQPEVEPAVRPPNLIDQIFIEMPEVDPDRLMLSGVDVAASRFWPQYKIGEMAKHYFGFTPYWGRQRERRGDFGRREESIDGIIRVFAPDGVEIGRRIGDESRVYTLADIERLAHALAASGAITAERAAWALAMVAFRAKIAHDLTLTYGDGTHARRPVPAAAVDLDDLGREG